MMMYLISFLILLIQTVYGYKWFAQIVYANNSCSASKINQITLFQANKCTQVNTNGVISSYSTDCTIAGNKILRTLTNWTNGYCDGDYAFFGPYSNNATFSTLCSSSVNSALKYSCDTDPYYESWPGLAKFNPNQYSSCSPFFGPEFIYAYPPFCVGQGSKSVSWECNNPNVKSITKYTYNPSNNCSGATQYINTYTLDSCLTVTGDYYACPLTILPGVAFLARGNDQLGAKIVNKVFVGGIFSIVLLGFFILMLGLTILFYYRRIYRPLKKLIMELANGETNRDSMQALENVGVGSFCSWLCNCGKINKEELKKLGE